MFYKNYLLILISLIMFSFSEKVEAKYEKLFFDLMSINESLIPYRKYLSLI